MTLLAVFAGGLLQGTAGFGFALLAAPLLVALLGPHEAVGAMVILGVVLNAGVALPGRAVQRRAAAGLLAWALPGLVAGAAALAALPERALSAAVCAAVLAGVAMRVAGGRRRPRPRPWALPAAGLTGGALTTSTGTNGPPLVLYLLHRGASPAQVRDTLGVVFLVLAAAGTAVLLAGGRLELPSAFGGLLAAGLAGLAAGRWLAPRLAAERHETLVLAVLTATALTAGAAAVT